MYNLKFFNMEYTNGFVIKPSNDTILAILCQLRHNRSMRKWIIIGLLITIVIVGIIAYLSFSDSLIWRNVKNQSEIGVVDDTKKDTEERPLYQDKYDYAVEYIQSNLGKNVELTEYIVVQDISEQTEYIFLQNGDFIDSNRISTGAFGTSQAMSESLWRVASKVESGLDSIYGARLMMLERYVGGTWINTTIALHGTDEPEKIGTPFGLGCFYHDNADIIALFDILSIGDFVVAID